MANSRLKTDELSKAGEWPQVWIGNRDELFISEIEKIHPYSPLFFERDHRTESFLDRDGIIHLGGPVALKSDDGGRTFVPDDTPIREQLAKTSLFRHPAASYLAQNNYSAHSDLFVALDGQLNYRSAGMYYTKMWRSPDNLRSLETGEAVFYIPKEVIGRPGPERWFGHPNHQTHFGKILELPGGTLIALLYGTVEEDKTIALGPEADADAVCRVYAVHSQDRGYTWHYLSTVAYPRQVRVDLIEAGFEEPDICRLDDGRLLVVLRTGHHTWGWQTWSSDNGKTWTRPQNSGLDGVVCPRLLKLSDGRVLLVYGKRAGAGYVATRNHRYYSERVNLALSNDGGEVWLGPVTVVTEARGAYPSAFEVEPNLLFIQVSNKYLRVRLRPKEERSVASFRYTGFKAPGEIKANEAFPVTVTVTNVGVMGTQKVKLYIDGKEADSKWVTMRAKERRKLSFIASPFYEPGAHQLAVCSAERSICASITIKAIPASFKYERKAVSSNRREILPRGPVGMGSAVKNIGSYPLTETVKLYIDGKVVDSKSLHLLPGEIKDVSFAYHFERAGTYEVAVGAPSSSRTIRIGERITPPWFSFVSTKDATFCQIEEHLYLNAKGRDGYAAVYQKSFEGDFIATVKLVSQESTTQRYEAGLLVSNNIADPNSSGYVLLAATPEAGPRFEWEGAGTEIESAGRTRVGKTTPLGNWCNGVYPIWLRLEKKGFRFTAYYSVDNLSWTKMARAEVPSRNQTQDIGLYVSPRSDEISSLVEFEEFRVEEAIKSK